MRLHQLPKLVRKKKRRGRGVSNQGAKSGRGMKGQRSRAGSHQRAGFEGGQTPLYMRLPKGRGTKQTFASQVKKPVAISTAQLQRFSDGSIVGPGQLRSAGLLTGRQDKVKLIGSTSLTQKLTIRVHATTPNARKAVEQSGGKIEIISPVQQGIPSKQAVK